MVTPQHTASAMWARASCCSFSSILTDLVVWLAATEWVAFARVDFELRGVNFAAVSVLALFLAGGQLVLGALVLLHRGRYVPGSFDELRALAVSVTAVAALATVVVLALHPAGLPAERPDSGVAARACRHGRHPLHQAPDRRDELPSEEREADA